ncbi:DUF2894 domain-containing protein [Ramlibacter algicola]|jgi:hypothetical protein|uniref:DUF2894 domain-containing protein n=1 Tax=Ramlibacter algicola TaxID=2795217 RepID=A0A934Q2N0_9BURK|nr:DUF2894 domain-containing protein [Ramlibacter algicola]MBK0393693.1 DUF2894 domain-containing protein [Ramlibacter algicola]
MTVRGAFTSWLPRHDASELAGARRFRHAYAQVQAVDRVAQVLARKPRNAGPLNSHTLVLQTLGKVQELSPAYLRRTVELIEALDWLEQAGTAPAPAKAPRRKR